MGHVSSLFRESDPSVSESTDGKNYGMHAVARKAQCCNEKYSPACGNGTQNEDVNAHVTTYRHERVPGRCGSFVFGKSSCPVPERIRTILFSRPPDSDAAGPLDFSTFRA